MTVFRGTISFPEVFRSRFIPRPSFRHLRFTALGCVFPLVVSLAVPSRAFEPTSEVGHVGVLRDALPIFEFPLAGGGTLRFSERAIREIADAAADADDPLGRSGDASVPAAHCDDELIEACSQRVLEQLEGIAEELANPASRDGFRARSELGRALHTVHDFYAHTNWVDIPGPGNSTPHPDLGILPIPGLGPLEVACRDDGLGGELDGLGLTGLTSGYDDFGQPPFDKCAHGDAGPGLHKDVPGRPRHSTARTLAVQSTLDVIERLVASLADDELAVRTLMSAPGTLGFVVDRTGSMGEEIAGVQEAINQIALASSGGAIVPGNFLLQLFADPELSPAVVTTDPLALQAVVEAVELVSGGDCPEPSLGAVLAAVGRASPNSQLFVFTDASAKDAELAGGVADAAVARRVRLDFVLTDRCGGAEFDPVFARLARATGGSVLLIGEDEVPDLFALIEPGLGGDLEPLLIVDAVLDDEERTWDVPLESDLESVTFAMSVEQADMVTVLRPGGVAVLASDPDAEVTELSTGRIVTVASPQAGSWAMRVAGDGPLWASASGVGSLGLVDFRFVERRGRPRHLGDFPVPGSPLTGVSAEYLATLAGDPSVVALEALAPDGSFLASLPSAPLGAADQRTGSTVLPAGEFRVSAVGEDATGAPFRRVFAPIFRAQPVRVDPPLGGAFLAPDQTRTAIFRIENLGPPDTFELTASDAQGLVVGVEPESLTLGTGQSSSGTVTLASGGQPGADLLSLVAQSTSNPDARNSARTVLEIEGGSGCSPAPRLNCLGSTKPGGAKLSLKASSGKLSWRWKKGEATSFDLLGDPLVDTEYGLCLYDTVGGLPVRVLDEQVLPGANWKAKKRGLRFKAPRGTEGLSKLVVSTGVDGKASIQAQGKRLRLPVLPVSQSDTFTVQLVNGAGACWSATYRPEASKNTSKKLSAKSE
ncbi:MAG: hypothetical protein ACR2PQ_01405 [Myxococcota bacterium]